MKPSTKRKRTENWDSSDRFLLQQLIQDRIHIIENKNVDTNTSRSKRAAWKEVVWAFNRRSNTKRDFPQIFNKWRRIKLHFKNRESAKERERGALEDGQIKKSPDDTNEHLMVFPKDEFIVDHSAYDYDNSIPNGSIAHSDELSKDRYFEKNEEAQHIKNKYEEEIENLRLERSLKIKAFEADERRKEEEHRIKLQYMKEEHQLKIELITEKIS